jgi:hypothetical protein
MAAYHGHIDMVVHLARLGLSFMNNRFAMEYAVANNRADLVPVLIRYRCELSAKTLLLAAKVNNFIIFRFLYVAGASREFVDDALMIAIQKGNEEIVMFLTQYFIFSNGSKHQMVRRFIVVKKHFIKTKNADAFRFFLQKTPFLPRVRANILVNLIMDAHYDLVEKILDPNKWSSYNWTAGVEVLDELMLKDRGLIYIRMYRVFGRPTDPARFVPANAFAIAVRDGRYDVAKHLIENFKFDRQILARTVVTLGFATAPARPEGPRDDPSNADAQPAAPPPVTRTSSAQELMNALSKALK